MNLIKKKTENNKVMREILDLMNKGEGNLTIIEIEKLRAMSLAVRAYEKRIYKLSET